MKKTILILALVLTVGIARANHWEPNPSLFPSYMTVTSIVQINGVEQTSTQLELGAFCGDEVRGSKYAKIAPNGRYIFLLPCWGNPGDQFTFRLYDAEHDVELDDLVCDVTLTYNQNGYGGALNPFVFNFTTAPQTFTLPIAGYGSGAGGYRLIAPPFDDIDPAEIVGMTSGEYDLYCFDQSQAGEEWRNYKTSPFNLESGKGYLYAHQADVTLTFTGLPYSGDGRVTLSRTEGKPFTGWNLVGNPFVQTATIDRDCYVMKVDGTEIIAGDTRNVDPMQGIFVIANENGETMAFSPGNSTDEGARIVVDVLQGRSPSALDRAMVRFGSDGTLPKLMLNPSNTRVYIPQEGTDYAVVGNSGDNATPICFKASQDGSYTLSFDLVNLDLDYLHLIDNKTGEDVNLLQTPSYTFQALTTDYAERFKLVYATANGVDETDKPFAYYLNGEICLFETADGASLQVVDTKGRMVVSHSGRLQYVPTAGMASGVYMLRLIKGDDVKVQKIVVK